MDEMTKIAVDAMGGDNAPLEIVKGVVEAVNENSKIKVYLTGLQEVIKKELVQYTYNTEQIEVVNATEVIETAEPPVMAIRKKKSMRELDIRLNLTQCGIMRFASHWRWKRSSVPGRALLSASGLL